MGFADMLVRMNVRYGSSSSLELADRLISFIRKQAENASRRIAESRGSFPNIGDSVIIGPRRNATVLSIAPTGTISLIAGCSSGIEPYYAVSYSRNVMDGQHFEEVLPLFISAAKQGGFYSPELLRKMTGAHSVHDIEEIPKEVRDIFVTAHEVPAELQIDLQATFQKHVDNAVSKTINLPATASWKDIYHALTYAHLKGCKGLTVYREGSKPGQVLTTIKDTSTCPACGRSIHAEEGAMQCESCG